MGMTVLHTNLQKRPTESLIPYARNARTHSEQQVQQIAASMREFGFTNPVLIDETGEIIAGHGRVMAAKHLALPEVPCLILTGLTAAQRQAYVLADNKLAELAGWDEDLLAQELKTLQSMDFDLELIGFDNDEISEMLALSEATPEGQTDPDDVPDAQTQIVTAPGDVWLLGRHRLMCGDSTNADNVAELLGGGQPHLMVTDPPYGVEYDPTHASNNSLKSGKVLNDDRADWREAWSLFPGDVAYVWHASTFTSIVLDSLESCGFQCRAMIIWSKDRFRLGRGHYHWQHEPAWYVVKKGATGHWNGDRKQTTVWNIKAREDHGHGHGTQKPVECMRRPIENNSLPGDSIYEPFSGSGTTIIAAEQTGRRCYAMELAPQYVDVAVRRWQRFTGNQAIHATTGQPFGD
jgi:DNA modification methylase